MSNQELEIYYHNISECYKSNLEKADLILKELLNKKEKEKNTRGSKWMQSEKK